MKDKIFGIILLTLLSSNVMAEVPAADDPNLLRDLQVTYMCGQVYAQWGANYDHYPIEMVELGFAFRKAGDEVAERVGVDWLATAQMKLDAANEVKEGARSIPVIPAQLDTLCTYMANVLGLL